MTVAVLEIHMERKAVAVMKPSTMRRVLEPMAAIMLRAIRRWRFQRSMARAKIKPPRNRNTVLSP
jgi:hypothetical protein